MHSTIATDISIPLCSILTAPPKGLALSSYTPFSSVARRVPVISRFRIQAFPVPMFPWQSQENSTCVDQAPEPNCEKNI